MARGGRRTSGPTRAGRRVATRRSTWRSSPACCWRRSRTTSGCMWIAIEGSTLASALLVGYYRRPGAVEAGWKYLRAVLGRHHARAARHRAALLLGRARVRRGPAGPAVDRRCAPRPRALDPRFVKLAFLFALVGYGAKAGLAPMHSWLPDAYTPGAHAGRRAHVHGAARHDARGAAALPRHHRARASARRGRAACWRSSALLSMLVAMPFMLVQGEYKRLLAYSSIEHTGFVTLAIGLGTPLARVRRHAAPAHAVARQVARRSSPAARSARANDSRRMDHWSGVLAASPGARRAASWCAGARAGGAAARRHVRVGVAGARRRVRGPAAARARSSRWWRSRSCFAGLAFHWTRVALGKPRAALATTASPRCIARPAVGAARAAGAASACGCPRRCARWSSRPRRWCAHDQRTLRRPVPARLRAARHPRALRRRGDRRRPHAACANAPWSCPPTGSPRSRGAVANEWGGTLIALFGLDERAEHGRFRLHAMFSMAPEDALLTLVAAVPEIAPAYRALTPLRAGRALARARVAGHARRDARGPPDPRPLIAHDGWPRGMHPLRKDFTPPANVSLAAALQRCRRVEGDGVFEIPVGPIHAGIIEPGHFRFSTVGESVLQLDVRLGWTWRGLEKLAEGAIGRRAGSSWPNASAARARSRTRWRSARRPRSSPASRCRRAGARCARWRPSSSASRATCSTWRASSTMSRGWWARPSSCGCTRSCARSATSSSATASCAACCVPGGVQRGPRRRAAACGCDACWRDLRADVPRAVAAAIAQLRA